MTESEQHENYILTQDKEDLKRFYSINISIYNILELIPTNLIHQLDLSNLQIQDYSFLRNHHELKQINLRNANLNDNNINKTLNSLFENKQIRFLDISDNKITNLNNVQVNPDNNILMLNIENNKIDEISHISTFLKKIPSLLYLSVQRNKFTFKNNQRKEIIKICTKLGALDNYQVSDEERVDFLVQNNPRYTACSHLMECKDIMTDKRWYQYKTNYTQGVGLRAKKDFQKWKEYFDDLKTNKQHMDSQSSLNTIVNSVIEHNKSIEEIKVENSICLFQDNIIEVDQVLNQLSLKENAKRRSPIMMIQKQFKKRKFQKIFSKAQQVLNRNIKLIQTFAKGLVSRRRVKLLTKRMEEDQKETVHFLVTDPKSIRLIIKVQRQVRLYLNDIRQLKLKKKASKQVGKLFRQNNRKVDQVLHMLNFEKQRKIYFMSSQMGIFREIMRRVKTTFNLATINVKKSTSLMLLRSPELDSLVYKHGLMLKLARNTLCGIIAKKDKNHEIRDNFNWISNNSTMQKKLSNLKNRKIQTQIDEYEKFKKLESNDYRVNNNQYEIYEQTPNNLQELKLFIHFVGKFNYDQFLSISKQICLKHFITDDINENSQMKPQLKVLNLIEKEKNNTDNATLFNRKVLGSQATPFSKLVDSVSDSTYTQFIYLPEKCMNRITAAVTIQSQFRMYMVRKKNNNVLHKLAQNRAQSMIRRAFKKFINKRRLRFLYLITNYLKDVSNYKLFYKSQEDYKLQIDEVTFCNLLKIKFYNLRQHINYHEQYVLFSINSKASNIYEFYPRFAGDFPRTAKSAFPIWCNVMMDNIRTDHFEYDIYSTSLEYQGAMNSMQNNLDFKITMLNETYQIEFKKYRDANGIVDSNEHNEDHHARRNSRIQQNSGYGKSHIKWGPGQFMLENDDIWEAKDIKEKFFAKLEAASALEEASRLKKKKKSQEAKEIEVVQPIKTKFHKKLLGFQDKVSLDKQMIDGKFAKQSESLQGIKRNRDFTTQKEFDYKDIIFANKNIKIENMRNYQSSKEGIESCRLIKIESKNFNDMLSIMMLVGMFTYESKSEKFVKLYTTHQFQKMSFSNFTHDNLDQFKLKHQPILTDEISQSKINDSLNNKYILLDRNNYHRKLLNEFSTTNMMNLTGMQTKNQENSKSQNLPAKFKNLQKKKKSLEVIKHNKSVDKIAQNNMQKTSLHQKYAENLSKVNYVKNQHVKKDNFVTEDQFMDTQQKNWELNDLNTELKHQQRELKYSVEEEYKSDLIKNVKAQRESCEISKIENVQSKVRTANSVRNQRHGNQRRLEDNTVDNIHHLIARKESIDMTRELGRQRALSGLNSMSIGKRLFRVGNTVQREVQTLVDHQNHEERRRMVVTQRVQTAEVKKRTRLSQVDEQNKRVMEMEEQKSRIQAQKEQQRVELERKRESVEAIRLSREFKLRETRSSNFPNLQMVSTQAASFRPKSSGMNSINKVKFTEEIIPVNRNSNYQGYQLRSSENIVLDKKNRINYSMRQKTEQ